MHKDWLTPYDDWIQLDSESFFLVQWPVVKIGTGKVSLKNLIDRATCDIITKDEFEYQAKRQSQTEFLRGELLFNFRVEDYLWEYQDDGEVLAVQYKGIVTKNMPRLSSHELFHSDNKEEYIKSQLESMVFNFDIVADAGRQMQHIFRDWRVNPNYLDDKNASLIIENQYMHVTVWSETIYPVRKRHFLGLEF